MLALLAALAAPKDSLQQDERLDPFEKMSLGDSLFAANWWAYEFWRYVFVQQEVAKLAKTALDFPPMQPGASFNLDEIKAKVQAAIANRTGN